MIKMMLQLLMLFKKKKKKNTCARDYFNKVARRKHKKSLWHRCLLVNFAKFLRTPALYRILPVAASDEIVGKFCKKELKKTNQRELRIKKY